MEEIKQDIREIKQAVQGQEISLTRYNLLLEEHIKRTEHLESRVEPIENHVMFLRQLGKLLMLILAAATSVATVLKLSGIL